MKLRALILALLVLTAAPPALAQAGPPTPRVALVISPSDETPDQAAAHAVSERLIAALAPDYLVVRPSTIPPEILVRCRTARATEASCAATELSRADARPGEVALLIWRGQEGAVGWTCVGRRGARTLGDIARFSIPAEEVSDPPSEWPRDRLAGAAACLTRAAAQGGW